MFSFFLCFGISAFLTLLLIKLAWLHGGALDADFLGVQKVHDDPVARIGGLPIFIAMLIGACVAQRLHPLMSPSLLSLLLCGASAFVGGIVEDHTGNVSASRRLLMTMLAALMAFFLADASSGFKYQAHRPAFRRLAHRRAMACIAADGGGGGRHRQCHQYYRRLQWPGQHGRQLAYVAWQVGDVLVLSAALMMAGATAGFLIWNYPIGLIFLGDGGAYFIGFMLGELALLLVMRNPAVSTWTWYLKPPGIAADISGV